MRRLLLAVLLLASACRSKERERTLAQLSSHGAKERLQAVKALAPQAAADEVFAALSRAAKDGSPAVRSAAAAALVGSRREDAVDAVAPLLRDPDDSVRIAAAQAMSCGGRGTAYLRLAFAHSDAAVRAQVAEALRKCGIPTGELLQREESERRRKALAQLESANAAQKAHGAHELGLLGRDQDVKALEPLLDDRNGVVVAAAARALGEARASGAVPRIAALVGEGGEVGAAAAEALLALHAQGVARPALEKLAKAEGDEAIAAALALGQDCAAALDAVSAKAASILAAQCEAAPFAQKLAKGRDQDAVLAALLQARGEAPQLDKALSRLLRSSEHDVRLPQLALRYRVAGPALVDVLRKEQAARAAQIAQKPREPDEGSAAEIAKAPAGAAPDKEKYDRLMARLRERAGSEALKSRAAAELGSLLYGSAQSDRRDFIAASLRAALALKTPGAEKVAALFSQDPDPLIAAAGRGEPETEPKQAPPPPHPSLWSDDGAVRAEACALADPALDATRRVLAASDPERRVRAACGAVNETAARK